MFDYILEIDCPTKDTTTVYQYHGSGKVLTAFIGKTEDAVDYAKKRIAHVFVESKYYANYGFCTICKMADDYKEQTGKRFVDYWIDKRPNTFFEMTYGLIDSELRWSIENIIQFGVDDTIVSDGIKEYIQNINKTILEVYGNDKEKALKGLEDLNQHIVKHPELKGVPNSRIEADFKIPEEFIYKPLGELFFLLQETNTVLE